MAGCDAVYAASAGARPSLYGKKGDALVASDDGGETWNAIATAEGGFNDIAVDHRRNRHLRRLAGPRASGSRTGPGRPWRRRPISSATPGDDGRRGPRGPGRRVRRQPQGHLFHERRGAPLGGRRRHLDEPDPANAAAPGPPRRRPRGALRPGPPAHAVRVRVDLVLRASGRSAAAAVPSGVASGRSSAGRRQGNAGAGAPKKPSRTR
jgi:hypothetical protein